MVITGGKKVDGDYVIVRKQSHMFCVVGDGVKNAELWWRGLHADLCACAWSVRI